MPTKVKSKSLKLKFDKPLSSSLAVADKNRGGMKFADGIELSSETHESLLKHCQDRLVWGKNHRDKLLSKYKAIDKELAGYIKLEKEDALRKAGTEKGEGPKPYPIFLQLTKTQLDEAMTFLLTVFFPEEGPYAATAPVEKQDIAKSFTFLLNKHATIFKHWQHFGKWALDGLKYNLGLLTVDWHDQYGTTIQNDATNLQALITNNTKLYSGNRLEYLDLYNTLYDPSVSPLQLAEFGEFFASVEIKSGFSLRRRLANNELFNVTKEYLNSKLVPKVTYYEQKPIIVDRSETGNAQGTTDWISLLSAGAQNTGVDTIGAFEQVKMRLVMDASLFGLTKESDYTIWEVEILNNERIVNLKQLKNAHGLLPIFANRPWDDNFGDQTSSFAEMLLPYQRFSSFQLNIHQHAARKALYGTTFYNSRIFGELVNGITGGGLVGTKSTAELEDIRKAILQVFDGPKTENTLRDIEAMDGLMQKILPTDILKQVTDLERATEYQSAATVQGANRRNLKIAQAIDTQGFDMVRQVQMYNVLEFQESMKLLDSKTGEFIDVQPSQYRDAQIEFILGAGIRGLDKLMIMGLVKDVLTLLVQNAEAAAKFDVGAIINYLTTLAGDSTNFAQFMYKNEFDKLTPQQKELAFQLLQQAVQAQAQQKGNPQQQA